MRTLLIKNQHLGIIGISLEIDSNSPGIGGIPPGIGDGDRGIRSNTPGIVRIIGIPLDVNSNTPGIGGSPPGVGDGDRGIGGNVVIFLVIHVAHRMIGRIPRTDQFRKRILVGKEM